NELKTKYISMNMQPKGSNLPIIETTDGVRYHFFSGIGRGMVFTRQGLFGVPLQFLPIIVPRSAKGERDKCPDDKDHDHRAEGYGC
ncbi:Hypothetical predicted protein, partial [Olea europaea subsp. europaea]